LRTLSGVADSLTSIASPQDRVVELQELYRNAIHEFTTVERLVRPQHGAAEWLSPVSQGLERYALAEGW
jgi:hypothetical protein